MWSLLALIPLSLFLNVGLVMLKTNKQHEYDLQRKTYLLGFPSTLSDDRVIAWLRSIGGTLYHGRGRMFGMPSIVFENLGTSRGIEHRMSIPYADAEYIVSQLRSLIPGVTVTPDTTKPTPNWTAGITVGMTKPLRQLTVSSTADVSTSLLASVQALGPDEMVLTQWILTPAAHRPLPAKNGKTMSDDFSVMRLLSGAFNVSPDELDDRRGKMNGQNLMSYGRIAAYAGDVNRARQLVTRVQKSLASMHSRGTRFKVTPATSNELGMINQARTPTFFTAQFTLGETAAALGWPIGQPFVAGLPQGSTRHLHATEDVAREGRVLGRSNYPGHERPIALDYNGAVKHMFVGGKTGTGKTVLMANAFAQDVAKGFGGIVIDAGNSDSGETMFSRALNYIPPDRLNDVIILDVDKSRSRPVGFNILDQGNPRIVVDQITDLFGYLYQDTKGVWTRELLFHGLYTLAERGGYTFIDLTTLITPRTPQEVVWADNITRGVKDPELGLFWQRWRNFTQMERDRYSQPLLNRAWQLISRPETRNIIGQSTSSFYMRDVLAGNKILLVSLAGVPAETASLLGTLLVNALWTAAQAMTPEKPNFLYLDEFQMMTRLPMGLDDMLARARKHKFGVVLGTQYLEDVPTELRNAVINNTGSRVIFQSSNREARTWQNEFGRQYVDENDFTRIRKYEAIAQLATPSGIGTPITLTANAPMPGTGVMRQAIQMSNEIYGRPVEAVQDEIAARRAPDPTPRARRPSVGIKDWSE